MQISARPFDEKRIHFSRRSRVYPSCLRERSDGGVVVQPNGCMINASFNAIIFCCSLNAGDMGRVTNAAATPSDRFLAERKTTCAGLVNASLIATISSLLKRLGTSPVLRIPLISSRNAS